jgi:hypothetical protein
MQAKQNNPDSKYNPDKNLDFSSDEIDEMKQLIELLSKPNQLDAQILEIIQQINNPAILEELKNNINHHRDLLKFNELHSKPTKARDLLERILSVCDDNDHDQARKNLESALSEIQAKQNALARNNASKKFFIEDIQSIASELNQTKQDHLRAQRVRIIQQINNPEILEELKNNINHHKDLTEFDKLYNEAAIAKDLLQRIVFICYTGDNTSTNHDINQTTKNLEYALSEIQAKQNALEGALAQKLNMHKTHISQNGNEYIQNSIIDTKDEQFNKEKQDFVKRMRAGLGHSNEVTQR